MIPIYHSLKHKAELTCDYLESIVGENELNSLVCGFDQEYCALALYDAIANPLFSHRLAALLYYSLLLQANQQNTVNTIKH